MGEGTPVTGMSVSAGAGSVAHGVHYAILGLGLVGLLVLLAPRRSAGRPLDEHTRRVADLRRTVATGGVTGRSALAVAAAPSTQGGQDRTSILWIPLAVVCTVAAAGAHAAVGPGHWESQALFGVFFSAAALAQAGWAAAASVRCSAVVLRVGAAGNTVLVVLWLATRTVGLPGVLAGREPVGPWDLACAVWELGAVLACLQAARGPVPRQAAGWVHWDHRARAACGVSAFVLLVLSMSGAGA